MRNPTLVVFALLLGCSAEPVTLPQCTPGAQVACACVGGSQGAQVCSASGTYGPCVCPDASVADVARYVNLCPASTLCTSAEDPSGSCFDTQTDRRHCGRCRNVCTAGMNCVAGQCVTP